MSKKGNQVVKKVSELIEPVLEALDIELVDVEYLSEKGKWVLRVYVDEEGGITLGDCARVSREIGTLIDVKDIIDHEYVLEVSSPGLNRPLKKEKDFQGAQGKKIKVRMKKPVEGQRNFSGLLRRFQEGILYVEVKDRVVPLSFSDVEKANLVYEFENGQPPSFFSQGVPFRDV